MFKGYCFMEDGSHTEGVELSSPEEAINYCKLQMILQYEVRIVMRMIILFYKLKKVKLSFLKGLRFRIKQFENCTSIKED